MVNGIQSIVGYILAQKYYRIPFEWGKICMLVGSVCILFFLVNSFTLDGTSVAAWLDRELHAPIAGLLHLLRLGAVKDGKLVAYVLGNITTIFEGGIKFLLACAFLLVLPLFGIVPKKLLRSMR